MRTTLSINDALLKEVRRRAGATGRPFRKVLEELISLGLAASRKSGKTRRQIRIKPRALGLKPAYYNVSLNQFFDQLEAERTAAKGRH